jgi:GT2 family glycosyltransferase
MNTFYTTAKYLADEADDGNDDDIDTITVLNKDTLLNPNDLPAAIQMLHKEASNLEVRIKYHQYN